VGGVVTVLEQSREALRAGVAAKGTRTWLNYTFVRKGLNYTLSQPIIIDLAATHQWLRSHVIRENLPKTGWWHCTEGPR
jgi:hypothetical protein